MAIQDQTDEFAERNLLLALALGMHSAGVGLDRLISRYGTFAAGPSSPHDETTVLCVLGLVSFFRRVDHVLTAAAATTPAGGHESAAPARPPAPSRELLR